MAASEAESGRRAARSRWTTASPSRPSEPRKAAGRAGAGRSCASEGITKRFGDAGGQRRASTSSCGAARCLALLGENGAGKTTLISILFGHYVADAGRCWWRPPGACVVAAGLAARGARGRHRHGAPALHAGRQAVACWTTSSWAPSRSGAGAAAPGGAAQAGAADRDLRPRGAAGRAGGELRSASGSGSRS